LELHPDDSWSVEGLASSYVANREPAKAIELLNSRRRVLVESPQAMNILAAALLAAGDAQAAERLLRQTLARDDRDPIAWLGLGQALVAQKQAQPAEEALGKALANAPDLMVARLDLIDLLVNQGRLDEAASAARAAADLWPDEYQPQMKLADVLAREKKYDASLAAFSQARKIAPFVFSPQSSLAIACYQLGDEQTAVRLLREAVAVDERDPVPRCFLGQIARRNSAWSDARKNLQLALELPIPRTWPASHVGQFLKLVYTEQLLLAEQLQDAELARTTLQAWAKLEPDNVGVRKMLAEIDGAKSSGSPNPAR
jgi:tetratricopeptide (TPR) repeat protein